ncbi:MAG: hypothetical protein A3I77_08285 [Gammaproteobacteria bacterium RIFCSPLOWO2_02_FULL_42_14]|nr:MAG: hypothetical protein A3B71_04120 [Gammaproteobacteria bacterium RIFCSPHIGHO2_02_FULL_42_43]OGT27587.1 MAG: hypothetical protein A2624_00425 [Gammaproteobacteria bacterium RIFCSPHIGHO2_01_FULL_42_8]OGT52898.1 MAG: hypothetical protein A3E54_07405 [Gammaproteobacteria bacterium RIFCSPHIGHO2_12_FULL_41_25]OGT61329.1 MAG: hypothetical protein A3I77_08285 [Gammaproteobacteria bacterium RIFCSPLOWO2_02_FULL_42_14]OGT87258.1 MAG: hypothetical protein A3G86_02010 [Gammaproteobacteria bacterium R
MLKNKPFLTNLDYMLFPISGFDWATNFSVDPFFWRRLVSVKTELIDIRSRGVLAPLIALQLSLTLSTIRKQNNIVIISTESEFINYAGYIYLNNQSLNSLFTIDEIVIYSSSFSISMEYFYEKYPVKNKKHGILKCKNLSIMCDSSAVVDEIDCLDTDSHFIYRAFEKLISEKKYEIAFLFCKDAFTDEVACAVITLT